MTRKGKRMNGGRKTESVPLQNKTLKKLTVNSQPSSARNLVKKDLAAVIFACKSSTFRECFSKQLFGLPAPHYAYVKRVTPGMPLFLFNCSDRKLFGIFEATSPGQLNIDKYAWTMDADASQTTTFPAQVRFKTRMLCQPLVEDQFKPIIINNYQQRDEHLFWFELDQNQTQNLISALSTSPVRPTTSNTRSLPNWGNLLKRSVEDIARQKACSSNETNLQMLPGSSSTSNVKGKNVAEDQGNATRHHQAKPWTSLFKPQNLSLEEEKTEKSETENSKSESLYTLSEEEEEEEDEEEEEEEEPYAVIEASLGIPEAPPTIVLETTSSVGEASGEISSAMNSEICSIFDKLLQAVEEIKIIQFAQTQKIESMDLELAEVNSKLKKLESDYENSGSRSSFLSDD